MAKLPIYTQQYTQQGPKASAESFGMAEGRAKQNLGNSLADLGNQLAAVEQRRQNRKDTIERARAINAFETDMMNEDTRMKGEEDISSTDAPGQYTVFGEKTIQNILKSHAGSAESKAILEAELLNSKQRFVSQFYKDSTKAQFAQIQTLLSQQSNRISAAAGNDPANIQGYLMEADKQVDLMASALTPEEEQGYRQAMKSQAISMSLDTLMTVGDYNTAEAILNSDDAVANLSPEAYRQAKFKIITGQREAEKGRIEGEQRLQMAETILGRRATAEERARIAGVNAPAGAQTFAEKKANIEMALQRPLTEAETLQLANISGDTDTLYGSSLRGRALGRVNDGITAFANGVMTPEQDQQFIVDVTEAYGPYQEKDPLTGLMVTKTRQAPPHIIEALNRRGMGALLSEQNAPAPVNVDPNVGVAPLQQGQTGLWDDIGKISGPIAAIEGQIEAMPFIGGMTEQDVTRGRKRISNLQRATVTALQNNPKYAVAEMKAIEQEIGLLPGVWSNPENAQAIMIAVDENLEQRQNAAYKTMNDRTLPVDARQAAANVFNIVNNVRSQFNLPPRVKTAEEARKLPPGTQFIDPNGNVRVVPNNLGGTDSGK